MGKIYYDTIFKFEYDVCGGQLTPGVLFRLRGLGLWPNNPVRGREHIRGLPVKEEMKNVL